MAETAVQAAKLPPRDALAFLRQKVPMPAATWTELWQEAHSVSFAVAGATSQALANDFHSAVLRTKEAGGTRREFQKEFDAIVARHGWEHTGTPGRRAAIIYDTNITTAYSAGRYRRQTAPESVALYPFWRYRHHNCQHPRPQHMAWDGMILRWDDPFWNTHYPPNGWRCHCTVEVVSQRMLDRNGWEVSDSPIIETRPWRNPHTGEIVHVPVGIDPGFAYNPGKAWLMNEGARVVTTPTPKLRPAFSPAQDMGPARKARTAPTTTPSLPAKPPVAPKASDVAQTPKPVATEPVPEAADDLKAQQDAVAELLHHPVGLVDAGTMPDNLRKALGSEARSVKLSGATVEKQLERHKDLSLADYLHVPEVIASPQLVVRESATHMRLFRNVGRIYRVVIKRTQDGSENFVVSCHVSRPHSVRQAIAGLEIMQGSLDDLLSGDE